MGDGRIGLSILQKHVVSRLVFLDQVVFQQQGVLLGVDHRVGDVPNLAYEHLGLVAVHFLVKIRGNALLETLGFSYVYDGVVLVVILVTARFVWHVQDDVLQISQTLFVFFSCHIRKLFISSQ